MEKLRRWKLVFNRQDGSIEECKLKSRHRTEQAAQQDATKIRRKKEKPSDFGSWL